MVEGSVGSVGSFLESLAQSGLPWIAHGEAHGWVFTLGIYHSIMEKLVPLLEKEHGIAG